MISVVYMLLKTREVTAGTQEGNQVGQHWSAWLSWIDLLGWNNDFGDKHVKLDMNGSYMVIKLKHCPGEKNVMKME